MQDELADSRQLPGVRPDSPRFGRKLRGSVQMHGDALQTSVAPEDGEPGDCGVQWIKVFRISTAHGDRFPKALAGVWKGNSASKETLVCGGQFS